MIILLGIVVLIGVVVLLKQHAARRAAAEEAARAALEESMQERSTALPPAEAASVAAELLVSHGAVITAQTSTTLSGVVRTRRKPSVLVAVVLALICIAPAIVYIVQASKDVEDPFTFAFKEAGGGTQIHRGGHGRGLAAVNWVTDQLAAMTAPEA